MSRFEQITRPNKWNQGKAQLSLVDPDFVEQVAQILAIGEERYGAGNWKEGGFEWSVIIDAAKRHLAAIEKGEDIDPDHGYSHAAAVASNMMFLDFYRRNGMTERDNRHFRNDRMPHLQAEEGAGEVRTESTGEVGFSVQQLQERAAGATPEGQEDHGPKAGDPVRHLQQRVADWADSVFPHRTAHGALQKMVLEEIPELLNGGLDDELEYADVLILLLDVAKLRGIDPIGAAHRKMDINESRTWKVNEETGLMNHVPRETSVSFQSLVKHVSGPYGAAKLETPAEFHVKHEKGEFYVYEGSSLLTVTKHPNLACFVCERLNSGESWDRLKVSNELNSAIAKSIIGSLPCSCTRPTKDGKCTNYSERVA